MYNINDYISAANALYRTKFTLSHELFLLRTQSFLTTKPSQTLFHKLYNSQFAYCVGHGMFIDFEYFKNRGFYPTEALNEVVPFGFYTSAENESIIPLQILENYETPHNIKSIIIGLPHF